MQSKIHSFKLIPTSSWPEYDVKITLKPSFKCNQMCWFCSEYDNNTRVWDESRCDLVLNKLAELPERYQNVFIYIYGGEPTLSKSWEYLQYSLVKLFSNRELYIQTQTNLSLNASRLDNFLLEINKIKQESHEVNICSSYHIGKQDVTEFIHKMSICEQHGSLGLCFFSTEIAKEEQMLHDWDKLIEKYPDHIKLKFTEIGDLLTRTDVEGYDHLLDDEYLVGDDAGMSLEYRYWVKKFPQWKQYSETGWNFDVDGHVLNYSEVKAKKINRKFKYMKCECGNKGAVIDHNLVVYHCNDDCYNDINGKKLTDVNFNEYFQRPVRCLNAECYDGLDFKKTR